MAAEFDHDRCHLHYKTDQPVKHVDNQIIRLVYLASPFVAFD